jgi:transcriptional regulator with XRE-family HTH domain
MKTDATFAQRLRALRVQSTLSVAELAQRSGLHRQVIYQLEAGDRTDPAWSTVQKLAKGLGVSTDQFNSCSV